MRALILALCAAALLSGCLSTIESAYDEQSRTQCEQESSARERGACLDRADRARRERN